MARWLWGVVLALGLGLAAPAVEARAPNPKPFGSKPKLGKPKHVRRPAPKPIVAKPAEVVIAPGLPARDAPLPELGPVPVLRPGDPTLRRPFGCVARPVVRYPQRVVYDCEGEDVVTADGITSTHVAVVIPSQLVAVFRTCPYRVVPALEAASDTYIAYEDPDVGRCYLWAPLDRAQLAKLGAYDRHDFLGSVHPYMAAVFLRALADAAARGDELHIINGAQPGAAKVSWHKFGLAVDVNLASRKGLGEATAAYLRGGDERRAWVAFAATAERLGLYWLGRRDAGEIFHFEWRPIWTGLPRGDIATEMGADVARAGCPEAWKRTRYDASRASAFRALRD